MAKGKQALGDETVMIEGEGGRAFLVVVWVVELTEGLFLIGRGGPDDSGPTFVGWFYDNGCVLMEVAKGC